MEFLYFDIIISEGRLLFFAIKKWAFIPHLRGGGILPVFFDKSNCSVVVW